MSLTQTEIKELNLTTPESIERIQRLRAAIALRKERSTVQHETVTEQPQVPPQLTDYDRKREHYKAHLIDLLEECPENAEGSPYEVIYQLDEITVYGGYEGGIRSTDHNFLLKDGVSWEDVLEMGTLSVPETNSYISNETLPQFEELGWSKMPLTHNHIVNSKNEPSVSAEELDKQLNKLVTAIQEPEMMVKSYDYDM